MERLLRELRSNEYEIILSKVLGPGVAKITAKKISGIEHMLSLELHAEEADHSLMMGFKPNNPADTAKCREELIKFGDHYMGTRVICSFTSEVRGSLSYFLFWSMQDDSDFLRKLVSDGLGCLGGQKFGVVFYNGQSIDDYLDPALQEMSERRAKLHEQYEGIYGLDPSFCNIDQVERASNLELFMLVADIASTRMNAVEKAQKHGLHQEAYSNLVNHFQQNEVEVIEHTYSLAADYVGYRICEKNGIKMGTPSSEHRLDVDSEEYERWVNFYANYLEENFSEEETLTLIKKFDAGEDLSMYEPKADWRCQ